MKKLALFPVIILLASCSVLRNSEPTKHVVIFDEFCPDLFWITSKDGTDTLDYIQNNYIWDRYYVLVILGERRGRYHVLYDSDDVLKNTHNGEAEGWISRDVPISIGLRDNDSDFKIYKWPCYRSPTTEYKYECRVCRHPNDFDAVFGMKRGWLKIAQKKPSGKIVYGWIPPEKQCSNPYTTCN